VTVTANDPDERCTVRAFWGPLFRRDGIVAQRASRGEADELAHAWADELAAGREPEAE